MDITVERFLTDHGMEYTTHWEGDYYPFEEYLDLNNILHRFTKVKHPLTKGSTERFQMAILEEYYLPTLLKKT